MPQWLKFELNVRYPHCDDEGNILESIKGRKKFHGGGIVYPECDRPRDKMLERYEKDGVLLMLLDITESEAEEIKTKDKILKYKATPKIMKDYNHKDFKVKRLTDNEAKVVKKDVFKIKDMISGVTK